MIPKTQVIPHCKIPEIDFLSQTPRNVKTSDTFQEVIIWGKEENQKKKFLEVGLR